MLIDSNQLYVRQELEFDNVKPAQTHVLDSLLILTALPPLHSFTSLEAVSSARETNLNCSIE